VRGSLLAADDVEAGGYYVQLLAAEYEVALQGELVPVWCGRERWGLGLGARSRQQAVCSHDSADTGTVYTAKGLHSPPSTLHSTLLLTVCRLDRCTVEAGAGKTPRG
jgi:hypothetical protein